MKHVSIRTPADVKKLLGEDNLKVVKTVKLNIPTKENKKIACINGMEKSGIEILEEPELQEGDTIKLIQNYFLEPKYTLTGKNYLEIKQSNNILGIDFNNNFYPLISTKRNTSYWQYIDKQSNNKFMVGDKILIKSTGKVGRIFRINTATYEVSFDGETNTKLYYENELESYRDKPVEQPAPKPKQVYPIIEHIISTGFNWKTFWRELGIISLMGAIFGCLIGLFVSAISATTGLIVGGIVFGIIIVIEIITGINSAKDDKKIIKHKITDAHGYVISED